MKKKVELSSYCIVISAIIIALLCGTFLYIIKQPDCFWPAMIWGAVVTVLLFSTLFYMPISISVDNQHLNINRPIQTKSIPLSDISSVKLCPPTMGAIRIIGSGGFSAGTDGSEKMTSANISLTTASLPIVSSSH